MNVLEPVETKAKALTKARTKSSKEEEQLASWKAYARKGQDSCNFSYRLSKTEQLRSGLHRPFLVVLFPSRAQPISLLR
jgi:hypothetical protein